MHYFSTSSFRKAIKELQKKPRHGYGSISIDICSDFNSKTVDEIRQNRDMILNETSFSLIKLRLPNSNLVLSKKDGFRLIYYVHKTKDVVVFLYVYPKRGPLGLITLKQNDIISKLNELLIENQKSELFEHNINAELTINLENTTF